MNFEYTVTRLKAIKSIFVSEGDIRRIANGERDADILWLISRSALGEGFENIPSGAKKDIKTETIIRGIEEGRKNILKKTARIINSMMPELLQPVFSRLELEQMKQCVRFILCSGQIPERRFAMLNLFGSHGSWVGKSGSFNSIKEFVDELEELGHPFSPAFRDIKKEAKGTEVEIAMERFYFQSYLPKREQSLLGIWDCFVLQNDMINLNFIYLLGNKHTSRSDLEKYFVRGLGKIKLQEALILAEMKLPELVSLLSRKYGFKIITEGNVGTVPLPSILRRAFLYILRRKAVVNPTGIADIFLFLEELSVMVSNLKLAVYFSRSKVSLANSENYLLLKETA